MIITSVMSIDHYWLKDNFNPEKSFGILALLSHFDEAEIANDEKFQVCRSGMRITVFSHVEDIELPVLT